MPTSPGLRNLSRIPPEHLPTQAVVIGDLEVLMKEEKPLAIPIALIAVRTQNNNLTDQVWLRFQDQGIQHRQTIDIYILESYARNHDANITRQEILTTTSPIFKDIPMETRSQYVAAAIHNYGKDIDMALGNF